MGYTGSSGSVRAEEPLISSSVGGSESLETKSVLAFVFFTTARCRGGSCTPSEIPSSGEHGVTRLLFTDGANMLQALEVM